MLKSYVIARNFREVPKYGSSWSVEVLINNNQMLPKKYSELLTQSCKIIIGLLVTLEIFQRNKLSWFLGVIIRLHNKYALPWTKLRKFQKPLESFPLGNL